MLPYSNPHKYWCLVEIHAIYKDLIKQKEIIQLGYPVQNGYNVQ